MKLIADSGSTKTDWVVLSDEGEVFLRHHTQGINPFHQSPSVISSVLSEELRPALPSSCRIDEVAFYGSGVRPELEDTMRRVISEALGVAGEAVFVGSDMLGAARALCGHSEGVACILGTGANSCLFDGERIVAGTPALGYVLGDEGSGAVLGRGLINLLYKGKPCEELRASFEKETGFTLPQVLQRVYREPLPQRFLASLAPFIHSHLDMEGGLLRNMVRSAFRDFFRLNIAPYGRPNLPVGAVGSVAFFFRELLAEAAQDEGFVLGRTLRSPVEGLIAST